MTDSDTRLLAAGAVGLGAAFVYSGIKGKGLLSLVQTTVKGGSPATAAAANPIIATPASVIAAATAASAASPITGGSSGISADALKYQGAGYVWGGAPAKGIGNWDCSSFANWVCGHDLGLAIPGVAAGQYSGASHGPPTGAWLLWGGIPSVGGSSSDAIAGDICIWQTHMGIAIGNGQMISALNSSSGTKVTSIDGIVPGEILTVKRYG